MKDNGGVDPKEIVLLVNTHGKWAKKNFTMMPWERKKLLKYF